MNAMWLTQANSTKVARFYPKDIVWDGGSLICGSASESQMRALDTTHALASNAPCRPTASGSFDPMIFFYFLFYFIKK